VSAEGRDELPDAIGKVRSRERDLMEFVRGSQFSFEQLARRLLE